MTNAAASGATLAGLESLVRHSLPLWGLSPQTRIGLANLSENATWRLDMPDGARAMLRVHREGYHRLEGIRSELAWLHALHEETGLIVPRPIAGLDGEEVQEGIVAGLARPRHMVLFDFIDGVEPEDGDSLMEPFRRLGEVSARLHLHAIGWRRPPGFERLVWDVEHVVGPGAYWGNWRDGPLEDAHQAVQIERLQETATARLRRYGRSPERFGLAHCDLRLANLLLVGNDARVIDFDDCGDSWFLYDLATAMTLIDNGPQSRGLIDAWLEGYLPYRSLDREDRLAIPSLLAMRHLAILAWFGSHADTVLAREHGPGFAAELCEMAEAYMTLPPSPDDLLPWA